jgi:hypothetical protein
MHRFGYPLDVLRSAPCERQYRLKSVDSKIDIGPKLINDLPLRAGDEWRKQHAALDVAPEVFGGLVR